MSGRVRASPPAYSLCSPSIIHRHLSSANPRSSRGRPLFSSNLRLFSSGFHKFSTISFRRNATGDSGENESKTILDAFFLGKAFAEALNERIESAVGEFLSSIGRFQAEQQKQVQEFQEEVLEKARRAKEQAAREAMEAQGLIPKSIQVNDVASNSSFAADSVDSASSSLQSELSTEEEEEEEEPENQT